MSEPPARLYEDPDASEEIRAALEAGRAERPSEAQLASLASKLGPLLGPGGGGGGGSGGGGVPTEVASLGSALPKLAAGIAIAAAVIAGGVFMLPPESPPPRAAQPSPREPPPELVEAVPPPMPEGLDMPEEVEPAAPEPSPAPRFEVDPLAEAQLIREAQSALRSDPGRALELTQSHARRFGDGALTQEREVVAIEALARLDRRTAAERRADRFRARWPSSAHVRRIDVILATEP